MRFPVFPRGSNPRVDRPILRKNRTYVEEQINLGLADWVNLADPRQGIIARELLRFGPKAQPDPVYTFSPAELPGLRFVPPPNTAHPSMASIRAGWDWSVDAATA